MQGTVTFKINNTAQPQTLGGQLISPNTLAFEGTNVVFSVAGVFTVSGSLSVTRQPNGTLDVSLSGAQLAVTVSGQEVFAIQGAASFSISPITGFRLSTFKVDGFSVFGEVGLGAPANSGAQPAKPPTADLSDPFNGKTLTTSQLNTLGHIDVLFTDRSGTGIKEASIIDGPAEFEVLLNGSSTGVPTFLTPTRVPGSNVFRYDVQRQLQRHRHRHRPLPAEHVLGQHERLGHAERRRDGAVLRRRGPAAERPAARRRRRSPCSRARRTASR